MAAGWNKDRVEVSMVSRIRCWSCRAAGLALLALGSGVARAGGLTSPGCLDGGQEATVAAVGDDLDLRLADGRDIRVSGLDPVRATDSRPSAAKDAREAVQRWLVGRIVRVAAVGSEPDRWGRTQALVFAPDAAAGSSDARVSVAEALLDAGFARARPDPAVASCWGDYLSLEAAARAVGAGLWSDPAYRIEPGDDSAALRGKTGEMAVVEGRITGLRDGRYRAYLPMGGHGRDAFAVTIEKRAMAQLARSGLDPKSWVGQRLRVRGFLDDRFGLQIEVSSGEQVEVVSP